jgi:hypothetical protein
VEYLKFSTDVRPKRGLKSALKMEAVHSSETLVSPYKSARCYNQEGQHRHIKRKCSISSHKNSNMELPSASPLRP